MHPTRHFLPCLVAAMLLTGAPAALADDGSAAAATSTDAASMPPHDLRLATPVRGDAHAGSGKIEVCAACHGKDGVATSPVFPSLAGQSATYLYLQLRAFKDGWRHNDSMQPMVAPLSDRDMRDIAAWYASLPRKATPHDTSGDDSRGATLYHQGDASRGIPGCQGCHGANGAGPRPDPDSSAPQPAWATFPALAGQPSAYVLAQLQAYRDGSRSGSTNTRVMHGVSAGLDDADMQALADYIAGMQP